MLFPPSDKEQDTLPAATTRVTATEPHKTSYSPLYSREKRRSLLFTPIPGYSVCGTRTHRRFLPCFCPPPPPRSTFFSAPADPPPLLQKSDLSPLVHSQHCAEKAGLRATSASLLAFLQPRPGQQKRQCLQLFSASRACIEAPAKKDFQICSSLFDAPTKLGIHRISCRGVTGHLHSYRRRENFFLGCLVRFSPRCSFYPLVRLLGRVCWVAWWLFREPGVW